MTGNFLTFDQIKDSPNLARIVPGPDEWRDGSRMTFKEQRRNHAQIEEFILAAIFGREPRPVADWDDDGDTNKPAPKQPAD